MAKKMKSKTSSSRKSKWPSDFGSHASMIDEAETTELNDPIKVVIRDDHGTYITLRNRLDNGLADPNRYSGRDLKIG